MLTAILACVLTGLIWTLVGVVFKYLASAKLDAQKYFLVNYFFTGLLGLFIFCKFDVVLAGEVIDPWNLIIFFGLAGVVNFFGLFFMQKAMTYGHGGVIWAIGQSALIVPFLVGILIFKQTGSFVQYLGLIIIICGMIIPALAGNKNSSEGYKGSSYVWFFMAVASLLLCGSAQTFMNIPSYWEGWFDNAHLRPSLSSISSFFAVLTVFIFKRKKLFPVERKIILIAFVMALITLCSLQTLFFALDRLSSYSMGAIGYPITVGACITGFSLYSMFVIKEKILWHNWVGLIATVSGIIIISL